MLISLSNLPALGKIQKNTQSKRRPVGLNKGMANTPPLIMKVGPLSSVVFRDVEVKMQNKEAHVRFDIQI